jgi:CBS domain-containing protein
MAADMEIGRQAYRETYITLRPLRKPWAFFLLVSTPLAAGKVLIANLIRLFQAKSGYLPELFPAIHCWTILIVEGVKEAEVMKSVSDILNSKGHEIWAVKPDDTVFDSLQLMAEKEIGALLVMDEGRLVGIVTERDYARKVILEGKSSKSSTVAEVMTKRVLCVTPERTIDECMALMTDKRARHLPVLDHKRVVGVISIGDLVKAMINEQQVLIDQLEHYISG